MTFRTRLAFAHAAGQWLPDHVVRRLTLASAETRAEPVLATRSGHQGARECARRCRHMARAALSVDGPPADGVPR